MNTLSTRAYPKARYTVRRRRYAEVPWLVNRNDWYELDDLANAIWCACDGTLTVEQITRRIAEIHALPLGEALAATVGAVVWFHDLELLDLQESYAEASSPC
jgi:Coenzyme PQQ synthesis protein D (PqqD)